MKHRSLQIVFSVSLLALIQSASAYGNIYLCYRANGEKYLSDEMTMKKNERCRKIDLPKSKNKDDRVKLGMTMKEVTDLWGVPQRVIRTTITAGVQELWKFDGANVNFSDGRVTKIEN